MLLLLCCGVAEGEECVGYSQELGPALLVRRHQQE
jgi:hypothetical protein